MITNPYIELTREFNRGGLRAILSGGQAVVLHRLAIMSKDGDWILRENAGDLEHVLSILDEHNARYRFGAPLDVRWMAGGWSSHFEFHGSGLRLRTDFVTRPPRLTTDRLALLWRQATGKDIPFTDASTLVELKKTNREKDYAVIGELARLMDNVKSQFLASRSARELTTLWEEHPELREEVVTERPILEKIPKGIIALEKALDAERRELMHANERRLTCYADAAARWREKWTEVTRKMSGLSLIKAHEAMVTNAEGVLPFKPDKHEP